MKRPACLLVAVALGGADAACLGPGWCVDRGRASYYQGSAQYGGSPGAPSGAAPMSLIVDDFDAQNQTQHSDPPSCSATFSVRLGPSCVLWADPTEINYDTGKNSSGDFIQANASIEGDGECTLEIVGQPTSFAVREGTLQVTPGHVQLSFDGTLTSSPDGGPPGVYFSVNYSGQ